MQGETAMKKRIVSLLLALLMAALLVPVQALAATVASGSCGMASSSVYWTLDSRGVMTISGTGRMANYEILYIRGEDGKLTSTGKTNAPWEELREQIKSLVVNAGVQSIGDYAFYGCKNLSGDIRLPFGITSIGNRAFMSCGMENVYLPESVDHIYDYAFCGCMALVSVEMPSRMTTLAEGAFYRDEKLQSIVVPAGVTEIGDHAFDDCKGLKRAVLHDGLVRLGTWAFSGTGLTSIDLPDSLAHLGYCGFLGTPLKSINIPASAAYIPGHCFSMTNIKDLAIPEGVKYIHGSAFIECSYLESVELPLSLVDIGNGAFHHAYGHKIQNVYYHGTQAQYAQKIAIHGDNDMLVGAERHYNSRLGGGAYTPLEKLSLTVQENRKDSHTLLPDYRVSKGAMVTCATSDKTDKYGYATVNNNYREAVISKSGYVTRTIPIAALEESPNVYLQKTDNTYPVISAVWVDGLHDVMNEAYSVPLSRTEPYSVTIEVDWGKSEPGSLSLQQGSTSLPLFTDGATDVSWNSMFDLSTQLLIVATNKDGKTSAHPLKLKSGTIETDIMDAFEFGFTDKLALTLPNSIPVIGESEYSMDIYSPVPIQYAIEDGRVYVAIGLQAGADEKGIKDFVNTSAALDKAKKDAAQTLEKYRKAAQNAGAKPARMPGSFGWECNFSLMGYAEGYFDEEHNIHWLSSGLIMEASGKLSFTRPFFIGAVPCYAEVSVSPALKAKLALLIANEMKNISPSGKVSGEIALDAGAGLGIKGAGTIGGGLTGKLSMDTTYRGSEVLQREARIGLEGYLKVTFLLFEGKLPVAEQEWIVYSYPDPNKAAAQAMNSVLDDTLYDTAGYQQADLRYLDKGSVFLAGGQPASGSGYPADVDDAYLISADSAAEALAGIVTVDGVTPFLLNAYENAGAQLLSLADGTRLAVWIGCDGQRSGTDRLCLFFSYDNGAGWSIPAQVDNDGTADWCFSLQDVNGEAWLVWQDMDSTIADTDTLDDVAAKSGITAARFDPAADSFDVFPISRQAGLGMLPTVCGDEDSVSVVWLRSGSNDLFANDGTNEICARTMERTYEVWDDTTPLYTGLNAVDRLTASRSGGQLNVSYCMDTDGDIATNGDMELYTNGAAQTNNSAVDSGAQHVNGQLVWYENGQLMQSGRVLVPQSAELRSDRYQLLTLADGTPQAVLFIGSSGLYSTLYGLFYDSRAGWGQPVALTDGSDCIRAFSAAAADGGMQVLVTRQAVVDPNSTEAPYGEARIDLLELTTGTDLAVDEASFDARYYMDNSQLPVTLTVSNRGRQTVQYVTIRFLDEDGTEIGREGVSVLLPPGSSTDIETGFVVDKAAQGRKVTVTAESLDNTDLDSGNNTAELVLGRQDLALEQAGSDMTDEGRAVIYGDVVNRGCDNSGSITASLRSGSADGTVLDTCRVEALTPMSMQHISFEADYAAGGVYYITLETEDDDPSNDWDFVVLAQRNETAVISGALDMGTEAGTVDITLKQGDTVVKQIISAGSFSFDGLTGDRYTVVVARAGYVPRSYEVYAGAAIDAALLRRGDINGAAGASGDVDVTDMACLYTLLSTGRYDGTIGAEDYRQQVLDVNGDGTVNILDYQLLYQAVAGTTVLE